MVQNRNVEIVEPITLNKKNITYLSDISGSPMQYLSDISDSPVAGSPIAGSPV
jgi:hypothetical protein